MKKGEEEEAVLCVWPKNKQHLSNEINNQRSMINKTAAVVKTGEEGLEHVRAQVWMLVTQWDDPTFTHIHIIYYCWC